MKKGQLIILATASAAILSLSSCGSSKAAAGNPEGSIESSKWKMESMNGEKNIAFTQGDSFTLEFLPQQKRIAGVGACNRFFGQYELIKRDDIDIKMGGSTMMACPNLNLEQPYFKMLDEANKYKLKDGKLFLYNTDKVIGIFNRYVTDIHNTENSLDYTGEYNGTLPAADCPGIKTSVILNKDNTFSMVMEYIDRNTKFTEKGKYSVDGNILTLKTDKNTQYYKLGENTITMLDNEGKAITGDLAPMYVLKKK